ncbi:hypothetical protein [Iamia sp. SCSIO 61187]|uniref:hypothetical protein n=1 Tax=Iamia sp. SCSIO 61187 TaxID=2722752 RepID=UPI001C6272EF|nr:hypothetical protein [Iamia sp. SCSIO 61187]
MFLIEIRFPRHALDDEDRQTLAADITDGITGGARRAHGRGDHATSQAHGARRLRAAR